mmetsp:Transcript_2479/g.4633  ORF Transcript_2479/g.4633 Transcript_2479/m.4633 type:complete len:711 (+) Transcript_2479:220-2352(+)
MEGIANLLFPNQKKMSLSAGATVKGIEHEYEDNPEDALTIVPENRTSFVSLPSADMKAVDSRLSLSPSDNGGDQTLNGNVNGNNDVVKTPSFPMDDTEHNIKGNGILASKKDVFTDPDEFAAGCKLLQAAALGNVQGIQSLLALRPYHINFRDYDRRTALHVAASEGQLDIVKILVERYNASINRSDRWGGSPLDDAHRHRQVEVVQYLRSKGASTGSTDLMTNLITAAAAGDLDDLQMLLSGFDGSQKGASQKSISQSKGISQRIKGVNGLLGASSGSKASSAAAAAAALRAPKIDVNGGDYDGRTALHLAAAAGHVKVCKFLISKGADVNVVDNWGGRPLDDAIRMKRVQCIKILKDNGAKVGERKHLDTSGTDTKAKEEKNLKVEFSELEVIDKIGSGAFGEIFKCRWRGTLVAAKCIKSTKIIEYWKEENMIATQRNYRKDAEMNEDEVKEALNDFRAETSILRTLRHPNIVMLLGYSTTENFEVMISELMKCSLLDIFKSHIIHRTRLPKRKQIIYAQQLARGMNYLHQCSPPIIHRDLKPANLLIDASGTLKISDFGLAKVRPDPSLSETDEFRMTGETGSYRFMAPEVFRHEDYTETVDVYSFAMIFYYLLSGRPPWEQLNGLKAVIKAATEADRPIIDRSWDSQLSSLMQRCWDENPSSRPSFSVILEELHEYSKVALKLDIDNISLADENYGCCNNRCVIS